jgi:hypothetical protein
MKRPLLLDVLLKNREITNDQVRSAFAAYKESNRPIGLILIDNGYVTRDVLTKYLSMEYEKLMTLDISY